MSSTAHLVCRGTGLHLRLGVPRRRRDGTVLGFAGIDTAPDFARALWKLVDDCAGGLWLDWDGEGEGREIGGRAEHGGIPFDDYLDEIDRDRITYYAELHPGFSRADPSGLVRRRHREIGFDVDELFTRDDRWLPTEYLRLYDLGHDDIDHVEITEAEAVAFVLDQLARHALRPR